MAISTPDLYTLLNRTPEPERPRYRGQTWISLFGEGPADIEGLLEIAGPFVDRAKIAYGCAILTSTETQKEINSILQNAGVDTYPGSSLLEMAHHFGHYEAFLDWAQGVGFGSVEVADGVIEITDSERSDLIRQAVSAGFNVTTVVQEVIRKPVIDVVPLNERIDRAKRDLDAGASCVHIVFQAIARGEVPSDLVGPIKIQQAERLAEDVGQENLAWEAASLEDQLTYLRSFGSDVNLAHVQPNTAVQLAAQRRGLGYESFWSEVWKRPHWS